VQETERAKSAELEQLNQLVIRPHSAREEYDYVRYVLERIPFYKRNGYPYEIPDHREFQKLAKQLSKGEVAYTESLFDIFKSGIYDVEFFKAGVEALESQRHKIAQAFPRFRELNSSWGFKIFPEYQITVTKYGPGGMYLENEGRIVMLTRQDGSFKRPEPLHTVVHEMIHIGIEESIVKKYDLTHWEKERLVDRICLLEFNHILTNYVLQRSGDLRLDPYITTGSITQLPDAIARFVRENPRI
jgi:hypothetical protein